MRHAEAGTKNDADPESLLSALTLTMVTGKLHWAYVPDPSLIHPTVWPRSEILVLGSPWTEEPT